MNDDKLRHLMSRIARGLPLVALGAAPFLVPACDTCPPSMTNEIVISSVPSADAGSADAGSDAGSPDASARPACWTLCETTPERPAGTLRSCGAFGDDILCTYDLVIDCGGAGRGPMRSVEVATAELPVDPIGRWFFELAIAELASVPAFEELAETLVEHGAPAALVRRARASADDEVRHARLAFMLAQRHERSGPVRVEVGAAATPSLREFALHNAKEGCVREAYGSIEAAWQAQHAEDETSRAVFAEIARDEAAHATLSLDLDAWARARLDAEELAALDDARDAARQQISETLASRVNPPGLGLPSASEAAALLAMV